MRLMIAVLLLANVCSGEIFDIEEFQWVNKDKVFSFSGKTILPPGGKIRVSIIYQEQIAATTWLKIQRKTWSGYLQFPKQELLPGKYLLHADLTALPNTQTQKLFENQPLQYSKEYNHQSHLAETTLQQQRQQVLEFLQQCRYALDRLILHSDKIYQDLQDSNNSQQAQQQWRNLTESLQLKNQQLQIQDSWQKVVVHPYLSSLQKVAVVSSQLIQLQQYFESQLQNNSGNNREFPYLLIHNIQQNATMALALLGKEKAWGYQTKCPRENFQTQGNKYISSTSKFKMTLSDPSLKIVAGEENAALRVTFRSKDWELCVYMLDLSDFTTTQQKIQAIERIATYEWKLFPSAGKFTSLKRRKNEKKRLRLEFLPENHQQRQIGGVAILGDKNIAYVLVAIAKTSQINLEEIFPQIVHNFSITR